MTIEFQEYPFGIVPKSDELRYKIRVSDFMSVTAKRATFTIKCAAYSGNVTVAGRIIPVDGTDEFVVALQIYNALKSSFHFASFEIVLNDDTITATNKDYTPLNNFTFDFPTTFIASSVNGNSGVPKNAQIWYQFLVNELPISEPVFANIAEKRGQSFGETQIDAKKTARLFLKTAPPQYNETLAVIVPDYEKQIRAKVGVIDFVSSVSVYRNAIISDGVTVFNAICQANDVEKLEPFTGGTLVKFLSTKPHGKIPISKNSHEWAQIALTARWYRFLYTFHYEGGIKLTHEIDQEIPKNGVYRVGIGTSNPSVFPQMGDCVKYELQVFTLNGTVTNPYSEIITKNLTATCYGEEIYFIDRLGCFSTIQFEEISDKETGISSVVVETETDKTTIINQSNPIQTASSVKYRATSDMVCYFEEFFESPTHYLRVCKKNADGYIMQKIIIDTKATIFKTGEFSQFFIQFTFAKNTDVQ